MFTITVSLILVRIKRMHPVFGLKLSFNCDQIGFVICSKHTFVITGAQLVQ